MLARGDLTNFSFFALVKRGAPKKDRTCYSLFGTLVHERARHSSRNRRWKHSSITNHGHQEATEGNVSTGSTLARTSYAGNNRSTIQARLRESHPDPPLSTPQVPVSPQPCSLYTPPRQIYSFLLLFTLPDDSSRGRTDAVITIVAAPENLWPPTRFRNLIRLGITQTNNDSEA